MASFRYQALNANGDPVAGELDADNVQQAIAQLESQGLTVQSIGYASSTPPGTATDVASTSAATSSAAASPADEEFVALEPLDVSLEQAVLQAHVAKILERSRGITPALRAYADELPSGRQRRQLVAVCRILARGNESEAAAALADLPDYWIPLLSAATSTSDPGHMLSEFLSETQRVDELRRHWRVALAYPTVLVGLTLAVMLGLSLFVIPQFAQIFNDFDLSLPGLTQLLLSMAKWLSSWTGIIFLVVLALLALVLLNTDRVIPRPLLAWLSDWIRPPFGNRAAVARFARYLADLLEAGVNLPDALRIAGHCIQRRRMRLAAWRLAGLVERSGPKLLRDHPRPLSATVCHAVCAKMPLPVRIHLLREISALHAERVRVGLSWSSGLVEPVAICAVGFVIGLVVLGLFIPLVKLVEGLSG
ncbi:MAG: type II secretion system F family protein [Pirellulales bacterium]